MSIPPMAGSSPEETDPAALRSHILLSLNEVPAMPAFIMRALNVLNDEDVEIEDAVEQLKFDPGMTANILRFANSALFGKPKAINSLHEALIRLGLKKACELIITFGVSGRLITKLPGYDLDADDLLNHSILVALMAEELCTTLKFPMPHMIFTAGMIHDIGKIVLDPFLNKHKLRIQQVIEADHLSFHQAEKAVLGIDHAEAGSVLLDSWNFPEPLVEIVKWHHEPEQGNAFIDAVSLIHIADIVAYARGVGSGVDGLQYKPSEKVMEQFDVQSDLLEEVSIQTFDKLQEMKMILK